MNTENTTTAGTPITTPSSRNTRTARTARAAARARNARVLLARAGAAAAASAALALSGAGAASAHVSIDPSATEAGGSALLAFGIPHGCGESPTRQVAITLPEGINDATPTAHANWTARKVTEKLGTPITTPDGATITERTSQIVYTAIKPLPAELRDDFVLSVKLPADAAGSTLRFPTLQTCTEGRTDWAQVPAEGGGHDAVEYPAPSIEVTSAAASGHAEDGHGEGGHATAGSDDGDASSPMAGASGAESAGWAGLVAGLAGLAMGTLAFVRTRSPRGSA
ncbi:YcnI family protein [Sinomonas halotolerans]|uniref:YcnI family protein n=1 Tax=Sinomonas halotolerans TaxID=1644133 RepID=A0ABU9X197_9MICC